MEINKTSLPDLCHATRKIVTETAVFIRQELGKVSTGEIIEKDLNSLVSYVDREAEQQLVSGLRALTPDAVFLTEEKTVAQAAGNLQWVIDPLDGTTNFLHQIPIFSISVALRQAEETVLGVILEVNREECFYAWKDGGAFLNERPIRVSETQVLADAVLATGFPYYDYSQMPKYLRVLEHFMQNTRGIRRLGSAAVDLAYVACGRFDAFFEYGLNPWDVAAGLCIIREAGGKTSDFRGAGDGFQGKEVLASNAGLVEAMKQELTARFYPEA